MTDDPKNWSPLRQYFEAFRGVKKLLTGPHETIPETLVRTVLAQQYGIKPEEVTPLQINMAVASLLPYYPAITVASISAIEKFRVIEPRIESVGAQLTRLREECRLTIEDLADLVKIDRTNVYRHLASKSIPHLRKIGVYERVFSKILKRKVVIEKTPRKRH